MQPLGKTQTRLVKRFRGSDVVVYAVPEGMFSFCKTSNRVELIALQGTPLPDDLILVHEHSDHYSLQPSVEMSVTGP